MATSLSDQQAVASEALATAFKEQENRRAAQIAAAIALYYRTRVNAEDPSSVESWLELIIPRLISSADDGARRAALFFDANRRIEVPTAPRFIADPNLGVIDEGVRKSLLAVGPYDYMNKMREIRTLENASPQQKQAMLVEAKQVTSVNLAQAVVRHAQAGSRQTIYDNSQRDQVAMGWVRLTKAKPCFFCAMLASRGVSYRAYSENSFDLSDSRFTGDGDAKVHDGCGCFLKAVYSDDDRFVKKTEQWQDMWSRWGSGGNTKVSAALRFRRGYDHWAKTGEYLDWDDVDKVS